MNQFGLATVLALSCAACGFSGREKGGLKPLEGVTVEQVHQAVRPRRIALLVGVNAFKDERWPALRHAVNDAVGLAEVLQEPSLGHFDQVELLADPGGTSLRQVERALDTLAERNQNPNDIVVVYFSTHGTLSRGPDGQLTRFLVLSDSAQGEIQTTALPVWKLQERFSALPSRRKALILASCHSGTGKSALPSSLTSELKGVKGAFFVKPLEEISQASMVLSACAWGETAREDDSLGHDIYTNFLIEALKGGDTDGDGGLTASEAHAQAMSRTYYFTGGQQRPQVESTISGTDPIVLTGERTRLAAPVLFSFLPRLEGLEVEVDGQTKGELPARLVVTEGKHRVVVREKGSPNPLVDERLDLDLGEEISVESLVDPYHEMVKPNALGVWTAVGFLGQFQPANLPDSRGAALEPSGQLGLFYERQLLPFFWVGGISTLGWWVAEPPALELGFTEATRSRNLTWSAAPYGKLGLSLGSLIGYLKVAPGFAVDFPGGNEATRAGFSLGAAAGASYRFVRRYGLMVELGYAGHFLRQDGGFTTRGELQCSLGGFYSF